MGVLPDTRPLDYDYGVVYSTNPDEASEIAAELAGDLARQLAGCALPARPLIRHGQPATEIADAARELRASVIVMGIGPHHAIDRALGGETALQLVQVASAAVLAVPADVAALPHRAVVGVDFTPSSVLAARTVARMLAAGDALHLVHVRAPGDRAPEGADAQRRLAALATVLGLRDGISVTTAVLDGPPSPALLAEVTRVKGDLIAMGSHGYGMWKRLTLGSVASKVLRLAATSVLVQPIGSVQQS